MSARWNETPEFKALHREWMRRAAESGHRDIEFADGSLMPEFSHRSAGAQDGELVAASQQRAEEALSDEMVWVGLSAKHRRFWALLVLGLSVEAAGRMVHGVRGGRGRERSHRWHREILGRIEG